ncbi:MAG: hypothetical protein GY856_36950 [bacterium]|nr:hypothetical protein [bacterium]
MNAELHAALLALLERVNASTEGKTFALGGHGSLGDRLLKARERANELLASTSEGGEDEEEMFYDTQGNRVTLDTLCRTEPEWAANCIRNLRSKLPDQPPAGGSTPPEAAPEESVKLKPHWKGYDDASEKEQAAYWRGSFDASEAWKRRMAKSKQSPLPAVVREALEQFVHDFEGDFVLDGLIVDGPGERWGPLVGLYEQAKAALTASPSPPVAAPREVVEALERLEGDAQWFLEQQDDDSNCATFLRTQLQVIDDALSLLRSPRSEPCSPQSAPLDRAAPLDTGVVEALEAIYNATYPPDGDASSDVRREKAHRLAGEALTTLRSSPSRTDAEVRAAVREVRSAQAEEPAICDHCRRPLASDEDWEKYEEGEGKHLCWSSGGACDVDPPAEEGEPDEYRIDVQYQCKFPAVGHEGCKEAYCTLGQTLGTLIADKDQQIAALQAQLTERGKVRDLRADLEQGGRDYVSRCREVERLRGLLEAAHDGFDARETPVGWSMAQRDAGWEAMDAIFDEVKRIRAALRTPEESASSDTEHPATDGGE